MLLWEGHLQGCSGCWLEWTSAPSWEGDLTGKGLCRRDKVKERKMRSFWSPGSLRGRMSVPLQKEKAKTRRSRDKRVEAGPGGAQS